MMMTFGASAQFSVSLSKQVTFSKGNLQYTRSTDTWSFAGTQCEVLGTANVRGGTSSYHQTFGSCLEGATLADKVDLFGWSTSANNFGVSTSRDYDDYSGSFVDWGTNKIGNDAPDTWRTLTEDEWQYLLNTRENASSLCGIAQVKGVNGLVLLPDNWKCPSGVSFKSGCHTKFGVCYYAYYQTFTADEWSKLEKAGAVFLPAAGVRFGTSLRFVQCETYYWSATEVAIGSARCIRIRSEKGAYMNIGSRYDGRAVRLVKDLQ